MKRIAVLVLVLFIASMAWAQSAPPDSEQWKSLDFYEKIIKTINFVGGFIMGVKSGGPSHPLAETIDSISLMYSDVDYIGAIVFRIDSFYQLPVNHTSSFLYAATMAVLEIGQSLDQEND